ncbi:unnamed protein product [Rotaria socialis]|uniref:CCHC-type domain-containing protein n=2 Tax=Rotaria socialis TaxID=392032 RepID=A0A818PF28_9BILA|nr:unnamed protein product [Rotaria socialis]
MDENANESDENPEIDTEVDDSNWLQQNRRNKRANKTPRTDYFVQGRTITSSSHGYSRMEKNITRHPSPQHTERMKKQNVNHEMSNFKNDQKNSCDDIQNLNVSNYNRNSNKNYEKEKDIQIIEKEYEQLHVSQHALKFAVENKLPPIKIQCEPQLKTQEEGSEIIKQFLKYIETNFRKLNPRYNQPLEFDHYMVVDSGELICFTNYIELFIYMCDINNYPNQLNNIKIKPILPTRLPARNAVILKFIDNKIKLDEVQMYVKEKFKSVYGIEEMLGTITYRSHHIRIDLLSKEEYINILNSGKFVIGGHLYEVDEYLPSPKILICNKCNTPGHVKKNCKSTIEVCRRCGNNRKNKDDHKVCCIICHHCGGDHEATNFKCILIFKFRQQLLQQLKNNTHLLPPHVQFYIPQQFRDQKDSENQVKLMAQSWQLLNFQSKTQTDAIADIYMTLSDGIPSIMDSMQNFNHILKDINKNITNDNERQQRDFVITRIDESINTVNNRLQLMTDHHKNLMIIINKQNELLVRGMNSIDQLSNGQ